MKTENLEPEPDELSLVTLAQKYSDETRARELLESLRWPNGPVCPHCQFTEVYKLTGKPTSRSPVRRGLYCCAACRKQFSVTVGTIFEDSHIPLGKWLMALFIMCSSKKSVSAHQLHRMLKITYKSAWFMAHRIRFAFGPNGGAPGKLSGTVEVDETFVGGKGDVRTKLLRKTPMVALLQRDGGMRTRVVSIVTQKNLRAAITECVDKTAMLNTDDSGRRLPRAVQGLQTS